MTFTPDINRLSQTLCRQHTCETESFTMKSITGCYIKRMLIQKQQTQNLEIESPALQMTSAGTDPARARLGPGGPSVAAPGRDARRDSESLTESLCLSEI